MVWNHGYILFFLLHRLQGSCVVYLSPSFQGAVDGSSAYVLHVSAKFSTSCCQAEWVLRHLQSNVDSSSIGQWLWDHVQSTEHEKHLEWECRCPTHVLLSCSGPGTQLCSSESQFICFQGHLPEPLSLSSLSFCMQLLLVMWLSSVLQGGSHLYLENLILACWNLIVILSALWDNV